LDYGKLWEMKNKVPPLIILSLIVISTVMVILVLIIISALMVTFARIVILAVMVILAPYCITILFA